MAEIKEHGDDGHEERMSSQTGCVHKVRVQPWRPQSVLYSQEEGKLGQHVMVWLLSGKIEAPA